jgi:hypothetical protein
MSELASALVAAPVDDLIGNHVGGRFIRAVRHRHG